MKKTFIYRYVVLVAAGAILKKKINKDIEAGKKSTNGELKVNSTKQLKSV